MAAYLYETIAGELEEQIASGDLRPGDRLPSVRQVCARFDVSLSTAVQALALLETRGLVEVRPQSGFYVRPKLSDAFMLDAPTRSRAIVTAAASTRVNTTPLINEVVSAALDPRILPLGAATIASELLPGAALAKAIGWVARDMGADGLMYEMPPGNADLRRQIALRAATYGCKVAAQDVVITTGSMEALNLSLRAVTRAGDTVAIESPMFYGIVEMLCSLDLKVAEIPTHPVTGMDLACLASTLKSRRIAAVIAITNFNNPLGSRMPDEAKKELATMLARADVPLVEDDIYGDLQHDGGRPITAKSYDRKGNVLLCSSFSKTLSPGLRVGWVLPGRHMERVQKLKFVSTIATATIPQAAVARFLERGGYEKHLRRLRSELCTRIGQYSLAIQRHFPAGTRLSQPQGGFLLWVAMPEGVNAVQLYHRARARGISIIPGPAFTSELGRYGNCIRISCGAALTRHVDEALATLGAEARALMV